MNEWNRFCLRTLSPLHVGCDEVYEPMAFVVDEEAGFLTGFDAFDFIRSLDGKDRNAFLEICRKGTIASILEVYKFMCGRRCAGSSVPVCGGFIEQYRRTLDLPVHDSRRIQQELGNFVIARTAFNPTDNRPYIPGSAIKGALRTAYLNTCAATKKPRTPGGRYANKELESKLLDSRSFETDPFRMLKVSDFEPVGEVRTRIVFAINRKKQPSKFEARGLYQILEVIEPGSLFTGSISVARPERGAGIREPLTGDAVFRSARSFYFKEMGRENGELSAIGAESVSPGKEDDAFPLRLGRHSGAECVTIDGHRSIRIKQAGEQDYKTEDHATTLWLASDFVKPDTNAGLRPFGWAKSQVLSKEMWAECEQTERDYALARKAAAEKADEIRSRGRHPLPPAKEAGGEESDPGKGTKQVVREVWKGATLDWNPGNQMLTAQSGKKKAFCKGRDLVPETLQISLTKKKKKGPVTANVTVEPIGNAFGIVKVEESDR